VILVLDASVALTWCFEEERTDETVRLLRAIGEKGAVAPLLWPLEIANILLAAERRRRCDAERRRHLVDFLRGLPVSLDDATAERAWDTTLLLAERHRLTTYDAAYLELALRRRLPLATLDRELRAAGSAMGVELLGL
jgi:predicted nucleic acid-binding protein